MAIKTVSAALGMFDGLHTAHREVLNTALKNGDVAVCVAFSNLPDNKSGQGLLMQNEVKEKILAEMGFEKTVLLDFNTVKDMSPTDFLKMLHRDYGITAFCAGYNYRFGKNAEGDAEFLRDYCNENGLSAFICDEYKFAGKTVCSSLIRECISAGDIEFAEQLLGRPFCILGRVVDGDKRGRVLGFPTINQILPENMAVPKFGVYITETVVDNRTYRSVTNVGVRPTFLATKPLCETNIIGFSGDLYGKKVLLNFKKFLRGEKKFKNIDELKASIAHDLSAAKEYKF